MIWFAIPENYLTELPGLSQDLQNIACSRLGSESSLANWDLINRDDYHEWRLYLVTLRHLESLRVRDNRSCAMTILIARRKTEWAAFVISLADVAVEVFCRVTGPLNTTYYTHNHSRVYSKCLLGLIARYIVPHRIYRADEPTVIISNKRRHNIYIFMHMHIYVYMHVHKYTRYECNHLQSGNFYWQLTQSYCI